MDETEDETGYKGWKLMKRMKFNVHFEIWKEWLNKYENRSNRSYRFKTNENRWEGVRMDDTDEKG